MKPGWKSRIDERRYFEELREKQFQSAMRRMRNRIAMEAAVIQLQMTSDREGFIMNTKRGEQ